MKTMNTMTDTNTMNPGDAVPVLLAIPAALVAANQTIANLQARQDRPAMLQLRRIAPMISAAVAAGRYTLDVELEPQMDDDERRAVIHTLRCMGYYAAMMCRPEGSLREAPLMLHVGWWGVER
jgi:roadblock/LC7 domain-containing protein